MTTKTYRPTEHTVEAFTEGDCWLLAIVLSKRTGWPIVIMHVLDEPGWWRHVAVQHPSGKILDIEGLQSEDDFFDRWEQQMDECCEEKADMQIYLAGEEAYKKVTYPIRFFSVDPYRVAKRLIESYA